MAESGEVEVLGGAMALVWDGNIVYVADAQGCGCSTVKDRYGHACGHQWGFFFASTVDAGGATRARETAA